MHYAEFYVAAPSKGMSVTKFIRGEQQQLLLHLNDGRKLFVFHGSTDAAVNADTLTKYRAVLSDKSIVVACCHGACMPQWVQDRFVDLALISLNPLTIVHSGKEGDDYFYMHT